MPILLAQQLPTIPIPLRPETPEAKLDLQAVLNLVYQRAGYDLVLDYQSAPPAPPLTDEQRGWVQELLQPTRTNT